MRCRVEGRGDGAIPKHCTTQEKVFGLAKAFDCVPRDKAFSELAKLAGSNDLKLIMEDFHRGTRYLLLGQDGPVSKKLCVSRGVRQGSVGGPVLFLALKNAIMDGVKDTRGSGGLHGVWESDNKSESEEEEEWLDVSEVAFVDDMLSFLVYDTEHTEGEKARKTSGDQSTGHPEGKKPDAMSRMLAFRLASLVEKQKNNLDKAVGALKEQHQDLAQRALRTVLITGKQGPRGASMSDTKMAKDRASGGSASSSRVHASIGRPEEHKNRGSSADQGRGRQSNDEQGSQGNQRRSQGQRKRRWLLLRPIETSKEVNRETGTARVRLCTKTTCGA